MIQKLILQGIPDLLTFFLEDSNVMKARQEARIDILGAVWYRNESTWQHMAFLVMKVGCKVMIIQMQFQQSDRLP